jgi:serine/threonine protein kinase
MGHCLNDPIAECGPTTIANRYQLHRQIGRGSTSAVWEATDLATAETVAVKVLRSRLISSSSARRRFHREVRAASALRHPHSVDVRSHGETADGRGYLVMERLIGMTLAARLREGGPLPQAQAIAVMAQVLDAVGAAHRIGIIHRDLKPSNVILVRRGEQADFVKVCDFGLAKAIQVHGKVTHASSRDGGATLEPITKRGAICGTPEYMAPEQARGEELDARADLYATAVMLFHLVVGQVPFRGRTPLAIVSLHLSAPPPRPSVLRPDLCIFPPLESLILRALAKDRAARPSSAEVFRADLLQIARDLAGVETTRRADRSRRDDDTLPATHPPSLWLRRTRARFTAVAAALALLLVGSVLLARGRMLAKRPISAAAVAAAHPPPDERAQGVVVPRSLSAPPALPMATVAIERSAKSRRPRQGPSDTLARAERLLESGRLEEACELAVAAATEAPARAPAWEFTGRCYMRLGRPEEARAAYRRFLRLAPHAPQAPFVEAIVRTANP